MQRKPKNKAELDTVLSQTTFKSDDRKPSLKVFEQDEDLKNFSLTRLFKKEYPKVTFNQLSFKIRVKFANTNTTASSLKLLVPPLIEFKMLGNRCDGIAQIKEHAKQRLVTDFPEIAKAFTVQKVCVNEAISLPDDLRLSAINRLGKSSLKANLL